MHRRTVPPKPCLINYIIMDQTGTVDHFCNHGNSPLSLCYGWFTLVVVADPSHQQGHHRTHTLPSTLRGKLILAACSQCRALNSQLLGE